ncbi:MAG: M56 family metallopeptidase [Clostridia bacterium]|nr:M56 family metallopeptidase [Clostridia bacterium]
MIDFLVTFGAMSLLMAAVIVFLLILRRPMRKRFTAGCRYIIWAVVIIRLCIPVGLGLMPKLFTVNMTVMPETEIVAKEPLTVPDTPEIIPDIGTDAGEVITDTQINTDIPQTQYQKPQTGTPKHTPQPKSELVLTQDLAVKGITLLWLCGAVCFIAVTLTKYFINIKKLTKNLTEPTEELKAIYLSVCSDMGLKTSPRLYINCAASSPMVCGFIRPRVLLPDMELSEDNIRYIIRHELVHYKRGDLWLKLLAMLANALHWFNPAVYMACGAFADETELSCDERVLDKTELKTRLDYGRSMLEIVKNCRTAPNLTTGFNPKKKAVKQRFENIIDTAKKRKGILIVVSVILVALIATSIIGCTDTRRYDAVASLDEATGLPDDEFRQYIFENKVFPVYGDESSEDWKLCYDDGALVLINADGRCFEYTENELEYPYVHQDPYYSADVTIYGNTAILSYCVPPDDTGYGRACFVMIDTRKGGIESSYSLDALEIAELHGGNAHDLSPFREGWEGEYYFTYGVNDDSARQGAYVIYLTMNTSLGELVNRLEWHSGWAPEDSSYELGRYTTDVEYITELNGMHNAEARDWLKKFLNHELTPDEVEESFDNISYEGYNELTFGDYLICIDDGTALIDIDITESGYDALSAGIHTFRYSYDRYDLNDYRLFISHSCTDCPDMSMNNQNQLEEQRVEDGIFHVYKDGWRGESVNWKLYYDFDSATLVLEHSDGRRYAYGAVAEGVHTLQTVYEHKDDTVARAYAMTDKYITIFYYTDGDDETVRDLNIAIIDQTNGDILAYSKYTAKDILNLHGLNEDIFPPFSVDELGIANPFHKGIWSYAFDSDDNSYITIQIGLRTDINDLGCYAEFNKDDNSLSTLEPAENTLELDKYVDDINEYKGENADMFKAFLNKDTEYLEKQAGYAEGTLDLYDTLVFGDYVFRNKSEHIPWLYVDIKESGIEGIEPGIHLFGCGVKDNVRYIYHSCPNHYFDHVIDHPASDWMNWSGEVMLPQNDGYTDIELWGMICVVRYSCIPESVEKYEEYIKMMFGVSVDLRSYTKEELDDRIENWGYKDRAEYNWAEIEYKEDNYVVLQFYADYGNTIPAYKVRYNFSQTLIESYSRPFNVYIFDGPSIKYDETGREAITG